MTANTAEGRVVSIEFEDGDGNPGTWVKIRVPDGSRWGAGSVRIIPLTSDEQEQV